MSDIKKLLTSKSSRDRNQALFDKLMDTIQGRYVDNINDVSVDLNDLENKPMDMEEDDELFFDSGYENQESSHNSCHKKRTSVTKTKSVSKSTSKVSTTKRVESIAPADYKNNQFDDALLLEELEHLHKTLSNKGPYAEKLITIMLQQLQDDNKIMYQLFINGDLKEPTWFPHIKVNSLNQPFIQFIPWSNVNDGSPIEEIRGYTSGVYGWSSTILKLILQSISVPKSKDKLQYGQKQIRHKSSSQSSDFAMMNSTPLKSDTAFNTSVKRIMPTRRCKNMSYCSQF